MEKEINILIGERIRYFRKIRGYTIMQLGEKIYKSKSAVSKYEKGEISIDVATLADITKALNVPLHALLPLQLAEREAPPQRKPLCEPLQQLYVYTWNGLAKNRLRSHVLQFSESRAELFSDIKDNGKLMDCDFYYIGRAQKTESLIRVTMQNQIQEMEVVVIQFFRPVNNQTDFDGFLTSYSIGQYPSFSLRCLLSSKPVSDREYLRERLLLSKAELKGVKTKNIFEFSSEWS